MMRLRRLDITRFGSFTDGTLDFGRKDDGGIDFHVIYGLNEAGKTTLMEAYLRLIYGFDVKDAYAFKHALANLQVGAEVEIGETINQLIRIKKSQNSLRTVSGELLPDNFFNGVLGGIGEKEYRQLFCLDDATIENGGEEITNSRGDFGRLLFSAAAGITNLSPILDHVNDRSQEFYKKGATKTKFADMKRQLDAVSMNIKDRDTTASTYHTLRHALEISKAREVTARTDREKLAKNKIRLSALISGYGISTQIQTLESELDPVRHYPEKLDIHPEVLVSMISDRAKMDEAISRQAKIIAGKKERLAGIIQMPHVLAHASAIRELEKKRGRMEGALADLPIRERERQDLLGATTEKLKQMGFSPGENPLSVIPSDFDLDNLDRSVSERRESQASVLQASKALDKAKQAMEESDNALSESSKPDKIVPDLDDLLVRLNAQNIVERHTNSETRIASARIALAKALRALSRGGSHFTDLPLAPMSVLQITDVINQLALLENQIATAKQQRTVLDLKRRKLHAKKDSFTSFEDFFSSEAAAESRMRRDEMWSAHKADLSEGSAARFETSMYSNDQAVDLRMSHSQRFAEYDQIRLTLDECQIDLDQQDEHSRELSEDHGRQEDLRKNYVSKCQLPDLRGTELVEWARMLDSARDARDNLLDFEEQGYPLQAAADNLQQQLSAALPDAVGLSAADAVRAVERQASQQRTQAAELNVKQDNNRQLHADYAQCEKDLEEAQRAAKSAEIGWHAQLQHSFRGISLPENVEEILPALRKLLVDVARASGLSKQIASMTRDRDEFSTQASTLVAISGLPEYALPFDVFQVASNKLGAAEEAEAEYQQLQQEIEQEIAIETSATELLRVQANQIRQLAAIFDTSVPTATIQDLRAAVLSGQEAIRLRKAIKERSTELCRTLGVSDRHQSKALLGQSTLEAATIELQALTADEPGVAREVDDAIAERSRCETQIAAIGGDGEVASLVTERRTLELEIESGISRYLEDRFSYVLADKALHRYRDSHRSTMLAETEMAFRTLTSGRYTSLTTQNDGKMEKLIAIARDGSSKQTSEMSKGTRYQLYLALRAAAYQQITKNGTILPFFCDDIFETFDEERTTAACGLMQQIGRVGQAIYLTHHRHVVDLALLVCGDKVKIHQLDV